MAAGLRALGKPGVIRTAAATPAGKWCASASLWGYPLISLETQGFTPMASLPGLSTVGDAAL